MMESIESRNQAPEQSPNFFEPPKSPEGIRRINWRLLGAVGGLLVLLFGIPVAYTYYDRFNPDHGSGGGDKEPITIQDAGPSPVKQPAEVVSYKQPVPVPVDQSGMVPTGLTEAERRAQEKKIADFEAARNASPRVENTASRQHQPRQQNAPMMPPPRGAGMYPSPPMQPGSEHEADANRQEHKKAFLQERDEGSPYLKHTRVAPLGATELKAGSVIPIVTIGGMTSDLPGMVTAQVRENVYDTATSRFILIPAGAKVYGISDSTVSAGQTRIMTAWQRIVFPDGSSVILDRMPGVDKSGYSGMEDQVDNHYLRTFGQAALIGLFMAGSQYGVSGGSANGNFNYAQILGASIGMQGFNLGSQVIRRNMNIQPTLIVRPGSLANIAVTRDIILPPWRGHPLAQAGGR